MTRLTLLALTALGAWLAWTWFRGASLADRHEPDDIDWLAEFRRDHLPWGRA